MSRTKNPDAVYSVEDVVIAKELERNPAELAEKISKWYNTTAPVSATLKTTPTQFAKTAAKYGITQDELKTTYVGQQGRRVIAERKLTPEQAVEEYGLNPVVANALRATVKPKAPRKVRAKKEVAPANKEPVEASPVTENVTETAETPTESVDTESEVVYTAESETESAE